MTWNERMEKLKGHQKDRQGSSYHKASQIWHKIAQLTDRWIDGTDELMERSVYCTPSSSTRFFFYKNHESESQPGCS